MLFLLELAHDPAGLDGDEISADPFVRHVNAMAAYVRASRKAKDDGVPR